MRFNSILKNEKQVYMKLINDLVENHVQEFDDEDDKPKKKH